MEVNRHSQSQYKVAGQLPHKYDLLMLSNIRFFHRERGERRCSQNLQSAYSKEIGSGGFTVPGAGGVFRVRRKAMRSSISWGFSKTPKGGIGEISAG